MSSPNGAPKASGNPNAKPPPSFTVPSSRKRKVEPEPEEIEDQRPGGGEADLDEEQDAPRYRRDPEPEPRDARDELDRPAAREGYNTRVRARQSSAPQAPSGGFAPRSVARSATLGIRVTQEILEDYQFWLREVALQNRVPDKVVSGMVAEVLLEMLPEVERRVAEWAAQEQQQRRRR